MAGQRRVLVVDDEPSLADLYTIWLNEDSNVSTAYGGEETLQQVDSNTDVVVLDRRMPQVSGDEVLREIRDRRLGCRVAMVTAVDPDLDVLDLPFDEYLSKPVSKDDLTGTVDRLSRRLDHDPAVQRYLSLASKRAALAGAKPAETLCSSDDYLELVEEMDALEATHDAVADYVARERPHDG